MPTIKVLNTQTLMDIAITHYGSVVYATDIAHANNITITTDVANSTLQLPLIETTAEDAQLVKQISKLATPLATKYPL